MKLTEIKLKQTSTKSRLKDVSLKLAENEIALEDLKETNEHLEKQLEEAAENSGNTNNFVTVAKRNKSITREASTDQAALRKALLMDDVNDVKLNLHNLTASNVRLKLKLLMKRLLPFKRDIQVIKSRFGASVAVYFIFCRFM